MADTPKRDKFRVATRSLIFNKKNELLILEYVKYPVGFKWDFPGGHVDYGEQVRESAIREVKEETQLHIELGQLFETQVLNKKCIIYFLAKHLDGEVTISDEHSGCRWVKEEELESIEFSRDFMKDIATKAYSLKD